MSNITFIGATGETFIWRGLSAETIDTFRKQTAIFANHPHVGLTWHEAAFLNQLATTKHKGTNAKHKANNRIK